MQSKRNDASGEEINSQGHGTQDDLSKAHNENFKAMGHLWRQKGTMVFCTSCPFEHGFPISTRDILKGTGEDGLPIFEKVDII